jgi:acetamidase/formamidase
LTVEKGRTLRCPHFVTPSRSLKDEEDKGEYASLGIGSDLREAARTALRGLMDWLQAEKGLTRVESYMLASVAASLKMTEVVDMPNYAVACAIPLNTFHD